MSSKIQKKTNVKVLINVDCCSLVGNKMYLKKNELWYIIITPGVWWRKYVRLICMTEIEWCELFHVKFGEPPKYNKIFFSLLLQYSTIKK